MNKTCKIGNITLILGQNFKMDNNTTKLGNIQNAQLEQK